MKNKTIFAFLLIPFIAFIGACASHEVRPQNPAVVQKLAAIDRAQQAVVVIYRNDDSQGRGVHPTVTMNGKDFVAGLAPGHYVFEMDDKKSGTEVTLKPGDELYLRVDIVAGTWRAGGRITQVAGQQGGYEATRLDLIDAKAICQPEYR